MATNDERQALVARLTELASRSGCDSPVFNNCVLDGAPVLDMCLPCVASKAAAALAAPPAAPLYEYCPSCRRLGPLFGLAAIRSEETGGRHCISCFGKTESRLLPLWTAPPAAPPADLVAHLRRQRAFSERTFGPGTRTDGVLAHIRKELAEIERDPSDLSEWIDVVLLAFDGAWRHGHAPEAIAAMLTAKQAKNEARSWPDWRNAPANQPIEHDRSADAAPRVPETPSDESAWLIERDIDSTLHYWTGRVIDGREIGAWSPNHLDARRFARRVDAECMLTWHCGGNGRVAEHMWTPVRPRVPETPQGWQPIETAPKDRDILVFSHGVHYCVSWFDDGLMRGWSDGTLLLVPQPTVWQPLPAAPAVPPQEGR